VLDTYDVLLSDGIDGSENTIKKSWIYRDWSIPIRHMPGPIANPRLADIQPASAYVVTYPYLMCFINALENSNSLPGVENTADGIIATEDKGAQTSINEMAQTTPAALACAFYAPPLAALATPLPLSDEEPSAPILSTANASTQNGTNETVYTFSAVLTSIDEAPTLPVLAAPLILAGEEPSAPILATEDASTQTSTNEMVYSLSAVVTWIDEAPTPVFWPLRSLPQMRSRALPS
jgi:hypothetical protein